MDLKEAFYKQKEELNQLKRDYAKLEKKHIKAIKENAADERVQELLKKIQGLNNKMCFAIYVISEIISNIRSSYLVEIILLFVGTLALGGIIGFLIGLIVSKIRK